jgi:outer membrane receptor protein involved in Fe transport
MFAGELIISVGAVGQLVAAARVDVNCDYDTQFSPKASAVFTVAPDHNLRATYNHTYTTPSILQSHAYIPVPDLFAPNYDFLIINAIAFRVDQETW